MPANADDASRLLDRAAVNLTTAKTIAADDPEAAYTLGYDAARQALTALLWTQGLRPTTKGGHVVVYESVRAQLDPRWGRTIAPFNRMRQERNRIEYPTPGQPPSQPDIDTDLAKIEAIIEMAQMLLPELPVF